MPRDLIVFGEDWGGLPSSTQHLINRISHNRKVLWVNSIGLRKPRLSVRDMKRAWTKITAPTKKSTEVMQVKPNFPVVTLRTIPAPCSMWARNMAKNWMKSQLLPVIEHYGMKDPILWTSLPTAADLCGELNESAVVYYCCDDFGALTGVDHGCVLQHEQKLVEKADMILASSESLMSKFPENKTQYLPHGVDYSLFSTQVPRAIDLPTDGRPIAGFYGSLSNWLDYDMLEQVFRSMPEWHFVFIGQLELATNPLPNLPNVHWLGPKPHHALPSYSRHWQASMLPFVDNEQIKACNPLKLLEYITAGTPIVTTDFPALQPFKKLVHCVRSPREFKSALENSQFMINQSQPEAAARHSWDNRARELEGWLEAL
ncbi:glycosyltransferase [Vibrio nigripulchritudo]|uniref:glycosyltransferase n=1 Tax=Vibrio nigripulchritudo TaxID=28173 RepID=UPI0003B1F0EE|nr:glycosyltransferase [Vibrio nigripulchritudo]CCN72655.1 putative Glycosyltransferase SypN [Vibrio nigripulchritudo SFn118]